MYPVDMLKVTFHSGLQILACAQAPQTRLQVLRPAEGGLYTGMQQAFWRIGRVEGYRSMWRGVTSVAIGAGTLRLACTQKAINIDVVQARRTPSTLRHTRQSNTLWEGITLVIIHLPVVSFTRWSKWQKPD